MHSFILEGENLIKNARNLFGLKKKKELNYTAIFLSMKKKKIVIN